MSKDFDETGPSVREKSGFEEQGDRLLRTRWLKQSTLSGNSLAVSLTGRNE